jgi:HEPN domain-containing protein
MDRLNSARLLTSARKYLDAAEILQKHTKGVSLPAYFLACQGLELTLKGYLRGCGLSKNQLRKLGHDLERLVSYTDQRNLGHSVVFSATETLTISLINRYYQARDLQYTTSEYKEFPRLSDLLKVCEKTWSAVRKFCVTNRDLHFGLDTAVL